jgi:hypothetical protein
MNSAQNSSDKKVDEKAKKIAALRDLADGEMANLKQEKQEAVKKIKADKDHGRLTQLRERLDLTKNVQ